MAVVWSAFEAAAPELAALVAERFAAHPHHVLGTLAADGSPRLSGINVMIDAGELWLGSMPRAMKALDLRRDPRFALHCAPLDETLAAPDVRVRGVAISLAEDASSEWLSAYNPHSDSAEGEVFLLHIRDVVVVTVDGAQLRATRWSPEAGIVVTERR